MDLSYCKEQESSNKMHNEDLHIGLKKSRRKYGRRLERIKINIKESFPEDVDWIILAQDKIQWCALAP